MVLFVAQREDVRSVTAHCEIDPEFARLLARARPSGVLLRAVRFGFAGGGSVRYLGSVPVRPPRLRIPGALPPGSAAEEQA